MAEESASDLGRLVYRERSRRGWTMADLAAVTGVSAAYLSEIECGSRSPSGDRILSRLAAALGLSAEAVWYAAGRVPPGYRWPVDDPDELAAAWAAFRSSLLAGGGGGQVRAGAFRGGIGERQITDR